VELDERQESVGKKIREAELQKIPYILVVGEREQKDHSVAVRKRGGADAKDQSATSLDNFIGKITEEIKARK
jgi:threonyl-tRNA synthetase